MFYYIDVRNTIMMLPILFCITTVISCLSTVQQQINGSTTFFVFNNIFVFFLYKLMSITSTRGQGLDVGLVTQTLTCLTEQYFTRIMYLLLRGLQLKQLHVSYWQRNSQMSDLSNVDDRFCAQIQVSNQCETKFHTNKLL